MACMPWPVTYPCSIEGVDADLVAAATEGAEQLLWALTGRRFGVCTTTEAYRVVTCSSRGATPNWPILPYKGSDGEWRNAVCANGCCRLSVWHQPLREVIDVTVDGTSVTFARDGNDVLITDGCPVCNECQSPGIEVQYEYGIEPPSIAAFAKGEIACELIAGWTGASCKLSSRAVSVTRQGVTIEMEDARELLKDGLTGLPFSDQFIRTVNPNGLVRRSRVVSPDMPKRAW